MIKHLHYSIFAVMFSSLLLLGCDNDLQSNNFVGSGKEAVEQLNISSDEKIAETTLSVTLFPEEPTARDNLDVRINGPLKAQKVLWEVNGEFLPEATGQRLSHKFFSRGDEIAVQVFSEGQSAHTVTLVKNSPPEAVSVVISQQDICRGKTIEAVPEGFDIDGDEIDFRFIWTLNGQILPGEEGSVLSGDSFYKGDIVGLTIIPYDRESEGQPSRELKFKVSDAPPAFVSSPPQAFSAIEFIYQAKAVDPDGDEVVYALIEGPEGMTINRISGEVRWLIPPEATGDFEARIVAKSSNGQETFQDFSIEIKKG